MIYIHFVCYKQQTLTADMISDPHRPARCSNIGQFGRRGREKKRRRKKKKKDFTTHLRKSETGIKRRLPILRPQFQL